MTLEWLVLTVLAALIAVGVIVLIYYVVVWALGQFDISVPEKPLRIAFAILVLIVIYMIVAGHFSGPFFVRGRY